MATSDIPEIAESPDSSPIPPVLLSSISSTGSSGLRIPEAKDAFYGYTEEKSFQQVVIRLLLEGTQLTNLVVRLRRSIGPIDVVQMLTPMVAVTNLSLLRFLLLSQVMYFMRKMKMKNDN